MDARREDEVVRKTTDGKEEEARTATSAGRPDVGSAMEQLSQEMLEGGEGGESVEERIERALACPCVAELREGACGEAFKGAFACFMRSQAEEKGSDCVEQFITLQSCVVDHPEEFSEDLRESVEEEKGEENKKT